MSHGSFFASEIESGDVAVVVDGLYHHGLGPRHKEYLYALDRGVTVIGAASIGALRALELGAYGMRGFGVVHQLYRAGVFDGDDAVAVAHEADAPYASLSVPLANLYTAAQAARAAGVLETGGVDDVVSALRCEYYPTRTHARVIHVLRHTGRPRMARWYERQLDDDPYAFDQKREDCLGAIGAARHLVAAGAVGQVTGADGADWKTLFLRTWSNHFVGMAGSPPLAQRLAYQQIFDPGYARVWERYLTETYRGHQRGMAEGGGFDLEGDVSRRIGAERFPCSTTGRKADWLYDFICPVPDLSDPREVGLLLSAEESTDAGSVARHLRQTREFTDRHNGSMSGDTSDVLPEEAGKLLLCRIWNIASEELSRECRSRGIPHIKAAVRILQPFIVGAIKERAHLRAERV